MTKTKDKPRTSHKTDVHRDLALVTPLLRGPDVKQLQLQTNHLADHYEFDWHHIEADGEYGKRTARQVAFCMELIGIHTDLCKKTRRTGHISELNQRKLRNPEKRDRADRQREENRRPRFKKLRKSHKEGLEAAVSWMEEQARKHVNESPPSSNHGPYPIDECQAHFGLSGVPWCGCCVGFAIEDIAGIGDTGTWWPHAASIRADAEGGRNGLEDINPAQIVRGVVCTFFNGGDDHVTFARGNISGGVIPTVEGNTSSATRDSDGGILEIKERSVGELTCAARLTIN